MHVVGSVKGHPEMIWATIEHIDNAPDSKYKYQNTTGVNATQKAAYSTSTSGSNSNWLFSDGTKSNPNVKKASLCTQNNGDICPPPEASNITSTNVARVNPWGVKESIAGSAEVVSELLSMNTSIFNALKSFNHTAGTSGNVINDPRENHYVSGATWGDNGVIPTSFQSNTEGSPYLANSTMETFVQDTGCFGCHSAVLFKTNKKINDLSTSHIFTTIKSVLKK
jgi:hypothetical protein